MAETQEAEEEQAVEGALKSTQHQEIAASTLVGETLRFKGLLSLFSSLSYVLGVDART